MKKKDDVMTKKIDTLQGLRFFAFLLIFTWHLNGYLGIKINNFASVAVTFFIVLSGFVSMLTLEKHVSMDKNILTNSIQYTKNRFSNIYFLYIITLILYLPLSIKNLVLEDHLSILLFVFYFFINICLLEAWKFKYFNGISYAGWYLSILSFLSFITIPIYHLLKKWNSKNKISKNVIIIGFCFILFYVYSFIIGNRNPTFYFYVFPIHHIFEYLAGICLANIYLEIKQKKTGKHLFKTFTIMEVILSSLVIFVLFFMNKKHDFILSITNMSIALLLIGVFMFQKGAISKFLQWKPFVFLGNISGEMYLIHNVLIAYILGIFQIVLPHNLLIQIFSSTLILGLTILLSYLVHYKNYKKMYYKIVGKWKCRKLKHSDFTIISNNCFGGIIYRNNALPYRTPTAGLFFMANDYILFIYHMQTYLEQDLVEIKIEDSKYYEYLKKIDYQAPIGKLGDIEIMFLHYSTFQEAKEKWDRRKKRINYDKIIYKFSDQNECTYENLIQFQQFPAKNKLCFTAKEYKNVDSIVFGEYESLGYVENDTKEKIFKKYINIYDYVNERFEENNEK